MKILFLILGLIIIPFIICACMISGTKAREEEMKELFKDDEV